MRLSATYNFFDGGELLVRSVEIIRPNVDHVSIVTQQISNLGNAQSPRSTDAVAELLRRGLVDDVEFFTPDRSRSAGENEFAKRARGLALARRAGCTHFLFVDADEFYDPDAFAAATSAIDRHGWETTSVEVMNYYGRPTWRVRDPFEFVPFICRTSSTPVFLGSFPQQVDPTRTVTWSGSTHHAFPATEIVMHHMTGVRLDLEEKLANSSLNDDPEQIAASRGRYERIHDLGPGRFVLPDGAVVDIVEVDDVFGLGPVFVD